MITLVQIQSGQLPSTEEFDTALNSFMKGCQKLIKDYWEKNNYTHSLPPVLSAERGSRYVKLIRNDVDNNGNPTNSRSVFCFIDLTGGKIKSVPHFVGSVLKPASFNAPAIHARGNIFDENNGLRGMAWTGPAYLK